MRLRDDATFPPIDEAAWDAPSWPPHRALAFLVVVMVTVPAVFAVYMWQQDGAEVEDELPTTFEGWLYNGFYARSRFECNRSVWGGTVVGDGDPMDMANWDEADLTVPVLAYDALELTDESVMAFVDRALPWLYTEDMVMTRDGPNAGRTWQVVLRADGIRLELDRRGLLTFDLDMLVGPGDVIGSTEAAEETFLDLLEESGIMPTEDQVLDIVTVRKTIRGTDDRYIYEVRVSRRMEGLNIYTGEGVNQILARYEAGTGRMVYLSYHWPLLFAPFAVTDLPSPEDLLDHIVQQGNEDPTAMYQWSEELEYYEPNFLFKEGDGFVVKAKVFFFLPYRTVHKYSENPDQPWMLRTETHRYGVIFPDMVR